MKSKHITQPSYVQKPIKPRSLKASHPNNIDIRDSSDFREDWNVLSAYDVGYLTGKIVEEGRSKDLRKSINRPWDINEQKAGEYSCIGYAVTDMHYWHLCHDSQYDKEVLSARFNWIAAKEIDEFSTRPTTFIERAGSTLKAGLKVAYKYGAVPRNLLEYPNGNEKSYEGTPQQFYVLAEKYKISSYYNLMLGKTSFSKDEKSRDEVQVSIWKKWINDRGPILIRLTMDENWNECQGRLDAFNSHNHGKKHAALLVGFDDNSFTIRNSWGTEWGVDGYANASNNYVLKAIDEAFGMVLKSNEVGDSGIGEKPPSSWLEWLFN